MAKSHQSGMFGSVDDDMCMWLCVCIISRSFRLFFSKQKTVWLMCMHEQRMGRKNACKSSYMSQKDVQSIPVAVVHNGGNYTFRPKKRRRHRHYNTI